MAVASCSGDTANESGTRGDSTGAGSATASATATGTATDTTGDDSDSDGASGTDGGGSQSGGASTDSAGTSGATASASDSDGSSSGGTPKFDLGVFPDVGEPACEAGSGDPEFSYLWAANSIEGTISKIDTQTVQEVGRFYSRPDGQGSPSRTSVSLTGNVAVANRTGGVTKIWATESDCVESNGTPGIQTSTTNAPLAWDQEECRAWHIPFTYDSQRPLAWAPGEWDNVECKWGNERLWTAGRYGTNTDEVVLIDGDAGVIIDTVSVPGLKADSFGIYGAAVDAEGNFWGTGWASGNHLVRVEMANLNVTVWDGPSSTGKDGHWYGMAVDVDGQVWNCSDRAARFDPMTELWTVSDVLGSWAAGCMADSQPNGLLWMGTSGPTGVRGVDRQTFQVVYDWPTPSSYGVSIDFFGYVWAVNQSGAHRVDPMVGTVTSYNGLNGAYTYSDMTGAALNAVGGSPSG